MARIDQAEGGSEASVKITGLAVGRTWIVLQYGANAHPKTLIPLEVVESAEGEMGQVLQRSVSSISRSYLERNSVKRDRGSVERRRTEQVPPRSVARISGPSSVTWTVPVDAGCGETVCPE